MSDACSVGLFLNEVCEPSNSEIFYLPDSEEKELLKLRVNCDVESLCKSQERAYLISYASNHRRCCDPLKLHEAKLPSKDTREITIEVARRYANQLSLIPGKKMVLNMQKTSQINSPRRDARPFWI